MSVAGVVVTMNRPQEVRRCVDSLLQEGAERVVVVDNGCGPSLASKRVSHIRTGDNIGPAGGFAVGMTEASREADYLWLLNDDDHVLPGALATLSAVLEGGPRIAAVGSWITDGVVTHGRGSLWRGREIKLHRRDPPASYDVDVTTFSGLLVRSAAVLEVGTPRSDFFMMFEEHEFCLRLRQAGHRIVVLREPLACALTLGSTGDVASGGWRLYYQTRNQLRYALDRREVVSVLWWAWRQLHRLAWSARKPIDRDFAASTRFIARGCLDAVRDRMGRTVEPG